MFEMIVNTHPHQVPMLVKIVAFACALSMTTWVMTIVKVMAMA